MNDHNEVAVKPEDRAEDRAQERRVAANAPAVDIFEDAAGVTVIADLPGVSRDRLNIRMEAEVLSIEAEASVVVPAEVRLVHGELREPSFRRSFRLGPEFDKDAIAANLKQGVLTLRVPRIREAQPRRIPVMGA